jgi:hypothetical protein
MAFCEGCGVDMWEYSEAAKSDGWCRGCAPEMYSGGTHVDAE